MDDSTFSYLFKFSSKNLLVKIKIIGTTADNPNIRGASINKLKVLFGGIYLISKSSLSSLCLDSIELK